MITACSASVDHEQKNPDPTGWRMSGGGWEEFRKQGDATVLHEGRPTARLAPRADSSVGYGTWMNSLYPFPYSNKRIRISIYTRTAGATRRADFWARVQGKGSPGDGYGLAGKFVRLPATSDWQRHEIVMDVPGDAQWVQYGIGIAGPGMMWMDQAKIEVVDESVPLTAGLRSTLTAGK
ncbi:MAG: hypothetical protein V4617_03240 [Gemmatimonadota bacterium]